MRTSEERTTSGQQAGGQRVPWLTLTLRLVLAAAVVMTGSFPRPVSAKQPPSDKEFEAKLQLFFAELEERMKDWPREDISEELPLDEKAHARIKRICEEVRAATQDAVRKRSWPDAQLQSDSISYVISDSEKTIEISYKGTLNADASNSRSVWQDMHLQFQDGSLKYKRWFTNRMPTGDNVLNPIVEREAQSILGLEKDAPQLSWPVSSDGHEKLVNEMNRMLNLYLKAFKDTLDGAAGTTGRIETIEYIHWLQEKEAKIRVTFDIKGTADEFMQPGIVVDYKQGRFRLKNIISPGWTGGVEYVADASNTAMDDAIGEWVKTFDAEDLFTDARVGPPFKWQEKAQDLPDNLGRIVHLTQRSHPFMGAEHHRRFRLELPDGRKRTFTFPADGGLVTRTDVYLVDENNKQFIRFQDDDHTVITIALDSLKICPSKRRPAVAPVLTFSE